MICNALVSQLCFHFFRPRPNFIAFSQITSSSQTTNEPPKRFVRDCFPVDPIALSNMTSPLVACSDFLSSPAPLYSSEMDEVVGFVKPKYLPLEIDLPSIKQPLPIDHEMRTRVFAKSLLEGEVIPFFKKFHNPSISHLRHHPSYLVGTMAVGNRLDLPCPSLAPALASFIKALQDKACATKRKLVECWKTNRKFLLKEFQQLLSPTCPTSLFSQLTVSWPPCV